jgi:hypothetical protein
VAKLEAKSVNLRRLFMQILEKEPSSRQRPLATDSVNQYASLFRGNNAYQMSKIK